MGEIPKAPIKRLITNDGAVRISEDALDRICEEVEQYVKDMSSELINLTRHANRKTIKTDDVKMVI